MLLKLCPLVYLDLILIDCHELLVAFGLNFVDGTEFVVCLLAETAVFGDSHSLEVLTNESD